MYGGRAPKGELRNKECMHVHMYVCMHCVTRACHGYLVIDRHIRTNLLSNGDYYFIFIVIVDIIFRDACVRVVRVLVL